MVWLATGVARAGKGGDAMSVNYFWNGPLLRLDLIGTTEPEDVIRRFEAALADPRATEKVDLLLDTTRSDSMAGRTPGEIRIVAEALKPYAERVQGRCAVVAAKDIHFGLSRMGSVYTELIGVDAGVFRTEAEAISWLHSHLPTG
jgi:hypothetical protein